MRTCLITGASGFIGKALASALAHAQQPWQLRLVGRSAARLPDCAGATQHTIRALDASTDWSGMLQGVDVVVHAAARVHVLHDTAIDAPVQYRRTNDEGTLRLAEQASAAGVKRLVFLSTIGIHGLGQDLPYQETDTPAPNGPYAQSKLDAERGLQALAVRTGLEVVVIRPPLVYGPDAPGNFARLAAVVRRGIPLPLGSVRNLRSLVGVSNLVSLIDTCMTHPAAAQQTFLVSDGQDLSTPDLIRRMGVALHRPARLLPMPLPLLRWGAACVGKQSTLQQLTSTLRADIRKARAVLNWTPPLTVDAALAEALSPQRRP
ncbi:NAD-dependent epimerase/dehydratase family protein [Acidovorax sp. BL-A-41-H1]|uniref:NAD-dependent epimerase/dehydratase family protein n=1 Tax=Acidovorax sp. BL-A-41-H1 TaxID=3421102 RepID=UPI003F795EF8